MTPHDTVDVAVDDKHGDKRSQDADEEDDVHHESHVNNGHERTR